MNRDCIKFDNVSFKYRNEEKCTLAINNVNTTINSGEFVAILGHNGSGKSTLAKHINALLKPTSGNVIVFSYDTSDDNLLWDIRSEAGLVSQNPDNQFVASIVEEDVAFGPENLGIEPSEIRERINSSLKAVGMSKYNNCLIHNLSGGQKQRVAIAGVLDMKPKCIVLDESTAMLDPQGRKEIMETAISLNRVYGITIVIKTLYMDEAVQADSVIVMNNGEVFMDDNPRNIFMQVDKLNEIGLDVPQVTQLAYELRKEGIEINRDILNVNEMVKALCQLKSEI